MGYRVGIVYSGYDADFDNRVEKKLGRAAGAGYGLGQRDMEWHVASEQEAKKLQKKIEEVVDQHKLKHACAFEVKVTISEAE